MSVETSCWRCTYHQKAGRTLLGYCRWFTVKQNVGAKPIPPEVVDQGCKMHEARA